MAAARRCGKFDAVGPDGSGQEIDNRLLHGRRSAANASSDTSADVVS